MKQNYVKPVFAVEMFSMAQSAARDCSNFAYKDNLNLADINSCALDISGITFFVVGNACQFDGDAVGEFGCYNNPSEGNYIFHS